MTTWVSVVANLADYLLREMEDRGWSRRDAAAHTGLSQATITKIVNNPDLTPRLPTLKKLAKGFRVPIKRLRELAGYPDDDEGAEQDEDLLAGISEADREFLRNLSPKQRRRMIALWREVYLSAEDDGPGES